MPDRPDKNDIRSHAISKFAAFLSVSGQSRTTERFAILDAVCGIEGVFTARMLYDVMRAQEKLPVSLATIYSTLALLEDSHIVVRHHFDRHTVSYEFAGTRRGFKYMICTKCGKVRRIESPMLDKSMDSVKTPRFHVENYSVYVYGICASCASLQKRKEKCQSSKRR